MTPAIVSTGLEVAVSHFADAERCATRNACTCCRRHAEDLRARIIGRRVRWVTSTRRDRGTLLTITDVTADGLVEVCGFSGQFAPHLFREA